MRFKTITILGGQGMLGSDLAAVAAGRGLSVRIHDLPDFDITDQSPLQGVVSTSEVIVNCAAYTNVEKAENEPSIANQVNGFAVGRLGLLAKEANVPVVHISTDFVFDGSKQTPYLEADTPHPVSVYGSSKLLGETLLAETGCENCIVRVQWTYGKNGVNFLTKICDAARTRNELRVVDDQIGSPTHTKEIAVVLCDMLNLNTFPAGIYHCAAAGYISRYEMTRFLFDMLGIQTPVVPCRTSDFTTAAKRPLNSRFDCHKLEKLLGRPMPSWQQMLNNYLTTEITKIH